MIDGIIINIRFEDINWLNILVAAAAILFWLLGLVTSISLFMLKSYSRWLLLAYFVLGLVATVSWIPYLGYSMTLFENHFIKVLSVELPNLLIVFLAFLMFRKFIGMQDREEIPRT